MQTEYKIVLKENDWLARYLIWLSENNEPYEIKQRRIFAQESIVEYYHIKTFRFEIETWAGKRFLYRKNIVNKEIVAYEIKD